MYLISKKITTSVFAGALCFCYLLAVALGRDIPPCPNAFVMAALYSRSGDLWVATEGEGLLKLSHDSDHWEKQKGNGLPGTVNFLSLVEDRQGRIWAGTDNQGVAVWNGESWMQYNQNNALLGERVPALAVSPLNGDVAIATSGGLTIYSAETEEWKDFTRANGLPEDQIVSLSFNEQGGLWAAFLTNGIGYASPASRYSYWKMVQTKFYWDKEQRIRQPVEARGKGLPSNFSNAVCAAGGSVWVGTIAGLGYGRSLHDWNFLRGRDYKRKNAGLWLDTGDKRKNRRAGSLSDSSLLPEDYVTCFYPVPGGMWVGFRESGACFVRTPSLTIREVDLKKEVEEKAPIYTTCFVVLPGGELYAGTHGHGLVKAGKTAVRPSPASGRTTSADHPRLPLLPAMRQMASLPAGRTSLSPEEKFDTCYWYEDWATQGDWCGRYGQGYALLCAANSPIGDIEYSFDPSYGCLPVRGPHANATWLKGAVTYINEPGMRSILYCPESTTRTLASWGDGGEDYPSTFDGPDLGAIVTVPEGRHLLSLYFYDPTPLAEYDLRNGMRDYLIEVRKMTSDFNLDMATGNAKLEKGRNPLQYLMEALTTTSSMPVQARGRVKSFSGGGVYKNFILDGKGCYYIRLVRNYSVNTTINGIFLSSLDETKKAWIRYNSIGKMSVPYGLKAPYPPSLKEQDLHKLPETLLASWAASQDVARKNLLEIWESRRQGIYIYRNLLTLDGLDHVKMNWRWHLKIWNDRDKNYFKRQMENAWESLQDCFVFYRSNEWSHYAPETTIPFSIEEVEKMQRNNIDWKQYRADSAVKPEVSIEEMKKWLKEH